MVYKADRPLSEEEQVAALLTIAELELEDIPSGLSLDSLYGYLREVRRKQNETIRKHNDLVKVLLHKLDREAVKENPLT